MLKVPEEIQQASGIRVMGKLIKSIVFTTDICIIRNVNADAVIAVYPFTPQPIITQAIMSAADIPVYGCRRRADAGQESSQSLDARRVSGCYRCCSECADIE